MATVVRTEKHQRTPFGQVIKWIFIGFNVLMIIWLVSGISAVSQMQVDSDAGRAGQAIGATIGFSMVLGIWMMGAIILGLFVLLTRGDKVIVEETPSGSSGRSFGQETFDASDADAVIARYKRHQAPIPKTSDRHSSLPSQRGFGRRL